jgi:hypothetical protein
LNELFQDWHIFGNTSPRKFILHTFSGFLDDTMFLNIGKRSGRIGDEK